MTSFYDPQYSLISFYFKHYHFHSDWWPNRGDITNVRPAACPRQVPHLAEMGRMSHRVSIDTLGHGSQTPLRISGVMEEKDMYVYVQLYKSQHSNILEGRFHYRYNVDAKFWLMNLTEVKVFDTCIHWLAVWTWRIKLSLKSSLYHNARFSFSPVITQSYSDTRWPPDTDTDKLAVARHKKRKILLSRSFTHQR